MSHPPKGAYFTEVEVASFHVQLHCEECRSDEPMVFNGRVLCSNPPLYPHRCKGCGAEVKARHIYPTIVHRPRAAP